MLLLWTAEGSCAMPLLWVLAGWQLAVVSRRIHCLCIMPMQLRSTPDTRPHLSKHTWGAGSAAAAGV